jgi:4-hydroxy-tetrahydrodipicolinate synthase
VAVKEASGNLPQISDVCGVVPDGFRVYSGDDGLTLPILSLGGHGVVSVAGHVVGAEIKEMVHRFPEDPAAARAMHHRLCPVVSALFCGPSPAPVKFALSLLGFNTVHLRLPMVPLDEQGRRTVEQALRGAGKL